MKFERLKLDRIVYVGYEPHVQKLYMGYSWRSACHVYHLVPDHLYTALISSSQPYIFFDTYIRNSFSRTQGNLDYVTNLIEQERLQRIIDDQQRIRDDQELAAGKAIRDAERKQRAKNEQTTRDYWLQLSGWQFEHKVADVFRHYGFCATVTRGSGDGGVDIRLRKGARKIIVQCKNHQKPIGPGVVRELFGVLVHEKADSAILVASGGYSSAAKTFARSNSIFLIQLDDLIRIRAGSHDRFNEFSEATTF